MKKTWSLQRNMEPILCPLSLQVNQLQTLLRSLGFFPPVIMAKALEVGPHIQQTFAKAYKAGVKIAFGTDAGVYAHGKNYIEFQYMTEAGMPAMEAIKAATCQCC